MIRNTAQKKMAHRDKSLTATGIVIAIIVILLISAYFKINTVLRQRSLNRLEEGVNTAIVEITSKFERDSRILNATASIISQADNFDIEDTLAIMKNTNPLLETMNVGILLPDDRILFADGTITEASKDGNISFAKEAPLGEHISNRTYNLATGQPILRHYVPIIQNGETAAMLYGITDLESLPDILNAGKLYNSSAFVYIIDTRSGDFLVDTWHDTLGNISDFDTDKSIRQTKGDKSWKGFTDDLINMNSGYVIYRTPNTDGWEYMYYAPIGVNKWSIAVDVSEKEAFTSVFAVRNVCIILGLLMAVTVIL